MHLIARINSISVTFIFLFYLIFFSPHLRGVLSIQMEELQNFINGNRKQWYIIIKDESEVASYDNAGKGTTRVSETLLECREGYLGWVKWDK